MLHGFHRPNVLLLHLRELSDLTLHPDPQLLHLRVGEWLTCPSQSDVRTGWCVWVCASKPLISGTLLCVESKVLFSFVFFARIRFKSCLPLSRCAHGSGLVDLLRYLESVGSVYTGTKLFCVLFTFCGCSNRIQPEQLSFIHHRGANSWCFTPTDKNKIAKTVRCFRFVFIRRHYIFLICIVIFSELLVICGVFTTQVVSRGAI